MALKDSVIQTSSATILHLAMQAGSETLVDSAIQTGSAALETIGGQCEPGDAVALGDAEKNMFQHADGLGDADGLGGAAGLGKPRYLGDAAGHGDAERIRDVMDSAIQKSRRRCRTRRSRRAWRRKRIGLESSETRMAQRS